MINTNNMISGNYTVNPSNRTDGVLNKVSGEKASQYQNANAFNNVGVICTINNKTALTRFDSVDGTVYQKGASKTTVLKVGSKGSKVKELQKNLTKLGYSTNGTDGIFGKDTKNAVIAFQKAYGLKADGMVGSGTQKAITKALDYQKKGILTEGSRGSKVKELQKNLTKLGYNTKGTDGIFGSGTKKAVIAFQKAHGLTADGIVGEKTKNAIEKALKKKKSGGTTNVNNTSSSTSKEIDKMLNNIKNNKSLGLTKEKKTAMLMAAKRLLKEKYEPAFVAGILGNIMNEGVAGKFESSNYKSNPSAEPEYLRYMDRNCNYRSKFSGKNIQDVGISAAIKLQKQAKASGYTGEFGLGMIQWTGERTEGLLKYYQKYAKSDKPTLNECIKAEVNYMIDELKNNKFSKIYTKWKSGNRTASYAGSLICTEYEKPKDMNIKAKSRANDASKIYNIMMK